MLAVCQNMVATLLNMLEICKQSMLKHASSVFKNFKSWNVINIVKNMLAMC